MIAAAFIAGVVCGVVFLTWWACATKGPDDLMGDMKGGCRRCRRD